MRTLLLRLMRWTTSELLLLDSGSSPTLAAAPTLAAIRILAAACILADTAATWYNVGGLMSSSMVLTLVLNTSTVNYFIISLYQFTSQLNPMHTRIANPVFPYFNTDTVRCVGRACYPPWWPNPTPKPQFLNPQTLTVRFVWQGMSSSKLPWAAFTDQPCHPSCTNRNSIRYKVFHQYVFTCCSDTCILCTNLCCLLFCRTSCVIIVRS